MADENKTNPPSSEIQQKALKFLEKKWTVNDKKCEICGGSHWAVQEHSVTPIILKDGGFQFGGSAYPQVMVVCQSCSNTKYFNTVVMDAIEKNQNSGGKDGK